MKKVSLLILFIVACIFSTQAQTADDILRYSRMSNYGTARSAAMGGAFGALGGDVSSIGINPAGVGVFRKSELSITPMLDIMNVKSNGENKRKTSFEAGDVGMIASFYNADLDWKGVNLGINYSNFNNFDKKLNQFVANSNSSLLDIYAIDASGLTPPYLNDYNNRLAYDAYLLNVVDSSKWIYKPILADGEVVNQYKTIVEDGNQGVFDIAFGTNYKDKLYLGISLSVYSIYQKIHTTYAEIGMENAPSDLDYYEVHEYTKVTGSGANMKIGAIYRPIPQLRLGVAIHTPTCYSMSYAYDSRVDSYFFHDYDATNGRKGSYAYGIPNEPDRFDYSMITPWRLVVSAAGVFMQRMIVSMDYEYTAYQTASYNVSDNSALDAYFSMENDKIEDIYRAGHHLRIGAEYRFNSIFSLRGGYSWQNSPYKNSGYDYVNSVPGGNATQIYSCGFGLNFGEVYVDGAWIQRRSRSTTIFYDNYENDIMAEPIYNKLIDNQYRMTLGFRF